MILHKILKQAFTFLLIASVTFIACTKANEEPEPAPPSKEDNISGKTVRYTVLVVPGGGTSFKSTMGIDSAIVSLVMNDSIYSVATDTTGLATFNNLAAGIVAVNIRYPEHTTANMVVDLSAAIDSGEYDSNNLRNASTMVALFPLTGPGTATISGRTLADLDITNGTLENAPNSLQITSYIEPTQLVSYVNHTGDGEILSIAYEQTINYTTTDTNSDYSIVVPATGSGLKIVITADDFVYDQVTAGGPQRKSFQSYSRYIANYLRWQLFH
ncbi:MAG: hypothetical protein HC831_12880 [Chloroflexia bacterium]|nr:hypothetical protein [Chloroflexia bacterium]